MFIQNMEVMNFYPITNKQQIQIPRFGQNNQVNNMLNLLDLNEAQKVQQKAKKDAFLYILQLSREEYQRELKIYFIQFQKFKEQNKSEIDRARVRKMLRTPLDVLIQDNNNEYNSKIEVDIKNKDRDVKSKTNNKNKDYDHLPYYDQIDQIVRKLKGAPVFPEYKVQLTEQNYMKSLKVFVNSFVTYGTQYVFKYKMGRGRSRRAHSGSNNKGTD